MGGTAAWRNRIAPHTASLMRRLTAAGMINLGKTHTVEFAYCCWGTSRHLGTPWSPWMPAHTASSGARPPASINDLRERLNSRCPRTRPISPNTKRRHEPDGLRDEKGEMLHGACSSDSTTNFNAMDRTS
jgi:hypothetical protein